MNDNVRVLVEKLKAKVDKRGQEALRDFLSNENMLSNSLADKQDIEFIKRMIFSQLYVYGMLSDHKYYEYETRNLDEMREEGGRLYRKIDSNGTILFNNEELDSILGNPLNIQSEEDYKKLSNYFYNTYSFSTFDKIYEIEQDKKSLDNCKNPIKKMILSRRIKKNEDYYTLRGPEASIVREVIKNEMIKHPNMNQHELSNRINQIMGRYLSEASKCFEVVDITKMTLSSLLTPERKPINIEEACKSFRREMGGTYSLMKEKVDYRKTDNFLEGIGKKVKNMDPEKIPEEMQKLQQEYLDAYENSKTDEEYIRRITRIFGKFVFLQPFEDCNKRTGICLLNAMLQSRGIRPIPFSVTHCKQLPYEMVRSAYDKAGTGEYGPLEDVMIKICQKEGRLSEDKANTPNRPNDKAKEAIEEIE